MTDTPRIHRPLYRVFLLSPAGGIVRADIIEAIDDEDAIRRVCATTSAHASELWDRARFIAKIEPPPNALAPGPIVSRRETPLVDAAPVEDETLPQRVHH